ncbi:hypothetical protein [Nocardioides aquiterrae]|uniref:hypothetical protein n=1 Tax=Nocardioides aquiterrae TaxID=203799 RepID=UPI0031DA94BB
MSQHVPELESYIDYRLQSLSQRNEHHKFEDICTRIARKRISANILVANGPVSSGGDQQRDAESYTTRIPDELPHSAGFAASASTFPVVVACTVQSEGLRAKVLADLAGICADAAADVELVAFFSVRSIPEGTTHELQRVAREQYGVTLDVYSGMKIATLLAEHDLIWIARHYLELPSSMVPEPEDDGPPDWYADLLENLRRNNGPAALTAATQGEITEGLRFATWDADTNGDLPEWLDFMGAFLADADNGSDEELVFRACYEMAVARFRGMGVATGVEDLVRRAIAFASSSSHPNVMEDAVTLASYWGVMWRAGVARAEASEIAAAVEQLRVHLVAELDGTEATTHPVRAASLTGTLAFLHLLPRWVKLEDEYGRPEPRDSDPNAGVRLDEFEVDTSHLLDDDLVDLDGAMRHLSALVDLLPEARPYSVRSLARVFTMFSPALSPQPDYAKVRDGLDAALALVDGDAAIADRCRNRAMVFVKAGKPLEAIHELHDAKARWFHGDTMYGSVLTMRYIGNLYRELGLTYAAKMYACSAAAMASQSADTALLAHVPAAFFEAVQATQLGGCWIDAAGLTEVALIAQSALVTDPFDYDKHPEVETAELNELMELVAVHGFWPELESLFEAAHPMTGWYQHLAEMLEAPENQMPLDEGRFQELAVAQFAGPVLGDLGPQRTIDFKALGVRWVFKFANDRSTVLTAEGFCAAFQVLLADIARYEPVLIRSTVRATITVPIGASHAVDDVEIDDFEPEIKAHITLSADAEAFDDIGPALVATAFQLLGPVHVRPDADLQALLEPLFRDGLPHKVTVARPYQDAADLLDDNHFDRCAAATRPASSDGYTPIENDHLLASTKTGPGYDQSEALELIRQRYEVAEEGWRYSIANLLADERGYAAIEALRNDGWLDWQILVAIVNVGMNWRLRESGIPIAAAGAQLAREIARQPEAEAGPHLPIGMLLDELDLHVALQTSSVAKRWGLRSRNEATGEWAMRDLLCRRYRYATDDVAHQDLLEALAPDGTLLSLLEEPSEE